MNRPAAHLGLMTDEPFSCDEPPLRLAEPLRAFELARRRFEAERAVLAAMLPAEAEILHVGATAVRGCLTKGDLDIVVRVPAKTFAAADGALAERYARNEGSARTDDFSAFEDPSGHPHLGVQLTAVGGPFDFFHCFVEALRNSPALLADYSALKRRYEGKAMAEYRAAKDVFIAAALESRRCED